MSTYTEEFLNALSRASSSVSSLMETVKEPTWKEKADYEHNLAVQKMSVEQTLGEKTSTFQHGLNIDSALLATELQKDLGDHEYLKEVDMEAIKQANRMKMTELEALIALGQINDATRQTYLDAGYEIGEPIDFKDSPKPRQRLIGAITPWEGLIPDFGLLGSQDSAESAGWFEQSGGVEAKEMFRSNLALYNMGVGQALRAATVNPNAPNVAEAIHDAEQGMEQALTLMEWSENQWYGKDADYYAEAYETLSTHLNALKNPSGVSHLRHGTNLQINMSEDSTY